MLYELQKINIYSLHLFKGVFINVVLLTFESIQIIWENCDLLFMTWSELHIRSLRLLALTKVLYEH